MFINTLKCCSIYYKIYNAFLINFRVVIVITTTLLYVAWVWFFFLNESVKNQDVTFHKDLCGIYARKYNRLCKKCTQIWANVVHLPQTEQILGSDTPNFCFNPQNHNGIKIVCCTYKIAKKMYFWLKNFLWVMKKWRRLEGNSICYCVKGCGNKW